ncbi:MAG: hypothetical protein ABS948_12275 [Solibacillus sp.]
MRIYKLTCVCTFILLLSGCNAFSSKTEEPSSKVESEIVKNMTHKENNEELTGGFRPLIIEEEVASPIGESKSYFNYAYSVPVKISFSNNGTESFIYKIQNVNKDIEITEGILKSNESFEQIYDELPEGDYIISYVVQEEENPINIKLKVKVELLP